MRAHGFSSDRQPEAKTGTIGATPLAEGLKQIARALWNAPAFVFDLHEQSLAAGLGPERDRSTGRRVLEGVLQQIHDRRCEQLRVRVDGQRGVDGLHSESNLSLLRVEVPGGGYFIDERGDREPLASLFSGGQTSLRQCAVHEVPDAREAAPEYRSGYSH